MAVYRQMTKFEWVEIEFAANTVPEDSYSAARRVDTKMVGQAQASKQKKDKNDKDHEKEKEDAGRTQFCRKDWEVLLQWLETENNLEAVGGSEGKTKVGGSEGKTKVGGKFPNKKQAYSDLAKFINAHQYKGSTLKPLTWEMARNRYNYLTTLHKKAKQAQESTGFGLIDKDVAKGMRTIEEKLDKICPCYERVNRLFGGSPRTELKINTLASDLGGSSNGVLPWAHLDNEAEADEAIALSDDDKSEDVDGEAVGKSPPTSAPLQDDPAEATAKESAQGFSPTTPMHANQTPLPVPQNSQPSPPQEEVSPGPANSFPEAIETSAAGATSRPAKSAPVKSKSNKSGSYPNKKATASKGGSLTAAFSSGMEALTMEKGKANEIKERVCEMRFASLQADRALRADTAQRKLDIEEHKLRIDEQRVAQEEKNSIMEARLKIVTDNAHRTPEEVIAILAAFTQGLS